jgi:hypothetical protein
MWEAIAADAYFLKESPPTGRVFIHEEESSPSDSKRHAHMKLDDGASVRAFKVCKTVIGGSIPPRAFKHIAQQSKLKKHHWRLGAF